jgi:hypothetical protein
MFAGVMSPCAIRWLWPYANALMNWWKVPRNTHWERVLQSAFCRGESHPARNPDEIQKIGRFPTLVNTDDMLMDQGSQRLDFGIVNESHFGFKTSIAANHFRTEIKVG